MKTAEEVADDLMNNGVNRTILAQALTAYAEERVKEAMKPKDALFVVLCLVWWISTGG